MSILRALERRGLERRGADPRSPWGDSSPAPPGSWRAMGGSERTALQIAAVYGCVNLLSESVAALPTDLMTTPHRRTGEMLSPSPLITQPYAEISLTDWWVQFVVSLALRGNFYGQIISRDRDLYATQIKPIHPDSATVKRLPDGTVEYRFHGDPVPIRNVVHVRLLSIAESLVGLNPIEYLRNILDMARAADVYGANVLQQSAVPLGTIETDEDLDVDEAKAWKESWLQMQQGTGRAGMPAVLTGGAKFNPISMNLEDLQFLESRQYDATVISGQIFRIPPHMIGIVDRTTSWGTGIEEQSIGYVRDTLMGYLIRGERMMTALHPAGQFMKFDLTERLRGDRLQRAQASALEIASGSLLPDEARAMEDRPPLPGGIGQTAIAPINAQALKDLANQSIVASQQQQPPPSSGGDTGGASNGRD